MLSRATSTLIRRQSAAIRSIATLRASSVAAGKISFARNSVTTGPSPASAFRSFSDSHDDFAPQKKTVPNEIDEAIEMIQQHVNDNPVMLYMKGNPSMPMCGFSAKIVQTLQAEGVDFSSVNVLDYPSIREGVKQFAAWPTIPQLYIKGEFIGGCDIVSEMHESGELKELLAEAKASD